MRLICALVFVHMEIILALVLHSVASETQTSKVKNVGEYIFSSEKYFKGFESFEFQFRTQVGLH